MPFALEQLTQGLTILGAINPQTLNGGGTASANCTDIDMSKVRRLLVILQTGSVTGGGSLTAKLQEATSAGGTYQDLASATISAMTSSNKVKTLEIRDDQLDA